MVQKINELIEKTGHYFLDQNQAIRFAVVCLLAEGHLLIEDAPGVGKTTLVQALGKHLGLATQRIQFTVDLLPADITGGHIFNPQNQKFQFYKGPLFAQLIMAGELNRTSPRTQSALLQAMEEAEVTVDGETMSLPHPFFVIATQNPQSSIGTFPLPESQLDRFLMSIELNYVDRETEKKIFLNPDLRTQLSQIQPLLNAEQILQIQKQVQQVKVSNIVAEYIVRLLEKSRQQKDFKYALSTRTGVALTKAAKAWAFTDSRDFVRTDDVKKIFSAVVGHRLGGLGGVKSGRQLAESLLAQTEVPA